MAEIATSLPQRRFAALAPRTVLLVALVVVASLIVIATASWAGRSEMLALADGVRRASEVHALALRGVAARYDYLPFTVARHPDIVAALRHPAEPGPIAIADRLLADLNRRAGSEAVYVMDLEGSTLAASNWDQPLSFVGQAYGNRPYFLDAREGRSSRFYGVGKTTGEPGLFLSTPVMEGGEVIGVVAVKVTLRPIEKAWSAARDPVLVSDDKGVVLLSSVQDWTYRTARDLSPSEIARIERDEQFGPGWLPIPLPWRRERSPGEESYIVTAELGNATRTFVARDEKLPDLGWTLTVMADRAGVAQARTRAGLLAGLGVGLIAMGGLYWRQRERMLREQRNARRELEVRVRQRTQELLDAHAFRKALEDSLLVGMRARDLEGRIIYVNPALCEMTGFHAEELLGRLPPYPYWHPEEIDKHWRDNEAAMSGKAAMSGFESRIRHRDGHDVHTMVYTAPLIDSQGQQTGWMSSVVDISEQKRADARRREQDEQLQRIARVVTVGEITSMLAHELNQPLAALVNYTAAACAFAEQGQARLLTETLGEIDLQAQRAADIVRHVRGLMRRSTDGFETIMANDIVARALAVLEPEFRLQGVNVEADLADGLPLVTGDRILLEQVLLNLMVNGIQAMRIVAPRRRILDVSTEAHGDGVRIRVSDRGPGIDPTAAAHLFDPFFTTKKDGVGLGLAICRTIIESHSGRIAFADRPDGGATFTVDLPGVA
ncbi:MAG: PAS domain S-box protein [Alsobacter sp.]